MTLLAMLAVKFPCYVSYSTYDMQAVTIRYESQHGYFYFAAETFQLLWNNQKNDFAMGPIQ